MSQLEKLALLGGPKAVRKETPELFHWPIITEEDEEAALRILRKGSMSGTDETVIFEKEFAEWHGTDYALAFNNGTNALLGAMYGCKLGVGDEIISTSTVYWASALPAFTLGATIVYADTDPETLSVDPDDIEHRITDRTKAIMVVHNYAHPANMDRIMEIAKKHNLKVIEDVSHAQGGYYKGQLLGTIGDVGAMSLMAGKSLAIGEGGAFVTNNLEIHERAIAFGHYERFNDQLKTDYLRDHAGLPYGGIKFRMHQVSSAVGRVQLKHYRDRIAVIDKAMNRFWDQLEGVPGLRAHRTDKNSGSTMGGWYAARGKYVPEELGGLSVTRFCEAVQAEGTMTSPGLNLPLHLHPLSHEVDVYGHGQPTINANSSRDVRTKIGSLPVAESVAKHLYSIPWFKHYEPELIDQHAAAFKKVALQYQELLEGDKGDPERLGSWNSTRINR